MRDSKKGFYAFIYCIGSAKGLYACIYWKKWRFGQVTPMPDRQTTELRATQLLYSIQFKLSHAIKNRIFIMHSRIRILHLMFMFSHPLKPTEDWTFSILYFVSEHRKIISMISCPFQNLPIKESLQSPSSFRSSLVERRQELHPRVV